VPPEDAKLIELYVDDEQRGLPVAAATRAPRDEIEERDAEFEAAWERFRRRRRKRWIRVVLGVLLVVALAIGALNFESVRISTREAWFRVAALTTDDELAGVDLQRVHAELLPAWLIARSNESDPGGTARADLAFNALLHAVAPSPKLARVVHLMRDATADPSKMVERTDHLVGLINDWNAQMARHGLPWWLDGNVMSGDGHVLFYIKSYRVRAELRAHVGRQPIDARIVARTDRLNVVENVLGHANPGDHAAAVLVDRLHDFALERVWPILGGELDNVAPAARLIAPLVREEVAAALSDATFRVLADTAPHRLRLLEVQRSVHQRHSCGNSLAIRAVPWNGLGRTDIRQLGRAATMSIGDSCPMITASEFEALKTSSLLLREDDRLRDAVAGLVAWLARSVTVHEVRHVADQVEARGLELPLPCTPCDDAMTMRARAELSAWMAELAWSDSGYTTLLHACTLDVHPRSATGKAIGKLLSMFGDPCKAPPPAIAMRARQLEARVFGRSQRIALPSDFPLRLTIER